MNSLQNEINLVGEIVNENLIELTTDNEFYNLFNRCGFFESIKKYNRVYKIVRKNGFHLQSEFNFYLSCLKYSEEKRCYRFSHIFSECYDFVKIESYDNISNKYFFVACFLNNKILIPENFEIKLQSKYWNKEKKYFAKFSV